MKKLFTKITQRFLPNVGKITAIYLAKVLKI